MIARSSPRRLQTNLLSYTRQNLPRPYRILRAYSSPTRRVNAATIEASSTHAPSYPPFMPPVDGADLKTDTARLNELHSFLHRRPAYTVLPTPLPDDRTSYLNEYFFTDSPTQDSLAIIDACLHNLYDVHRARQVFERLRQKALAVLDARVYNAFLSAYVEMATTKEPDNARMWIEDAWYLYSSMESGEEKVQPTATTYATMLLAYLRFGPDSPTPLEGALQCTHGTLLQSIVDREIKVTNVVADRVFATDEDAARAIRLLSRAAVESGWKNVVNELGMAEQLGMGSGYEDPLADVPEVKPVLRLVTRPEGEEGEGAQVEEMPFNLSNLRKHLADIALARRVLPEDVASRQKLLEESVYEVAVERLRHQAEKFEELGLDDSKLKQRDLRKWMWEWHQELVKRLEVKIKEIIRAEAASTRKRLPNAPPHLGPFLSLVKPQQLSLITILELMRMQGSGGIADGMKTARALLTVGRAVELEHKAQLLRRNNIALPAHSPEQIKFFTRVGYKELQTQRMAARKYVEDAEGWSADWTQFLRVRVGSILVDSLMDVATVTRTGINKNTGEEVSEEQPAFFHSYEYLRGQKLGIIRLNPAVAERMAKDRLSPTMHPRHLPMLIKPKPWISHDQGGYIFNKTSAMRYKDSQEQQSYLRHASSLGNVELVYAGLDVLGSTPWKINRAIFDVVLEVWNSGKRLCKLPPAAYDGPEPEKPPNHDTDQKARASYLVRLKAYSQAKANNHSDRCNVNYKIEIARAFLGDTMYLPHNMDFRGRAYPIPPHLNHIGDDLSRGLLKFAEAKPLGERGLRWLKIHLANLYGFDKGSFDERVQFVHEHIDDIYDSARNPLDGRRWWTQADDPWQCLATSMELYNALESPNPLEFESSLPVHQDGTCNGLQHYAALGGDDRGAQQVNLSVADRPSDVYTYVAHMVEGIIQEDMKKGSAVAALLAGKIARKVVKQTVMTTVYGVTYVGARAQIERQLKDRKDVPAEECWTAAAYLAKVVLSCIGDLFRGAQDIQTWLNLCARTVAKAIPEDRIPEALAAHTGRKTSRSVKAETRLKKEQMTSVVWTTPLGLPIVQPYRKTKRKQIMTALQTVFISDPNSPAEVNAQKQASAFPPNFIHSLDATHMMLTALECRSQNLTFASVHDSYWTHASTIDDMSAIIRETFIALHSSDVLQKLREEFCDRYKGYKVPLVALRTGQFAKQLAKAGTKLTVMRELASSLKGVDGKLLEVSDDVDESNEVTDALLDADDDLMEGVEHVKGQSEQEGDASAQVDAALLGKFVDVVDLIPPLPKKGCFNVSDIKESQYFFS